MEVSILSQILEKSLSVAILVIWGYYLLRYFIWSLEKKDTLNQENLVKFISISEKYSILTERIAASLERHIEKIDRHGAKLDQIHQDLKDIKNARKCFFPKEDHE